MDTIRGLLLPEGSYCYVCGGPDDGDMGGFCLRCRRLAEPGGPRCPVCRRALTPASGPGGKAPGAGSRLYFAAAGRCRECLVLPPPYLGVTAVGRYEGLLRSAIGRFKFGGETYLARPLARILAAALMADGVRGDVIVPVPPSPLGFRRRGFNQAELLARLVGRTLGLPLARALFRSVGPRQTKAGQAGRWRRGALSYGGREGAFPPGAAVLLIDDVVTTGATLHTCTSILLTAGASSVWCGVLADTPRQSTL